MKKASNYAYIAQKPKAASMNTANNNLFDFNQFQQQANEADLNVFVLAFDGMKQAQKNLAGGDPYDCKKCGAILNKFSKVQNFSQLKQNKFEVKEGQSLWTCQFCNYPNKLQIEKEQIPIKDDIVYMLESALEQGQSENDSTIIFCIDVSGSMNSTSQVTGKVDLKYGLSQQQIQMLKQFMQPGDQAQFNFLPGQHNKNKTFISRMQCVLSAIESQLGQIKKTDPNKKVGFILFNNEVLVVGDGKAENISIVGDRLNNGAQVLNALLNFKLTTPIAESYDGLVQKLNKTQAKGQTALGPALLSAIDVASKGSKGSTVVLCTDGLANIGVGALQGMSQNKQAYYQQLAKEAKLRNVSVNVITIKGQSSKLQILSKVVQATNGNIKVVNPQKISDDFANILKDQVIGLNVSAKVMLHKALVFRNQDLNILKDNKTILVKQFANATVKTKVSFQYEVRDQEDLKFMEMNIQNLKTVPFQAQITYTSPKGGKFLRVISSQSKTTTQKKEMEKQANINVVHQRVVANTALMYQRGEQMESKQYNDRWNGYLQNNFKAPQYQKQQIKFETKNRRLNEAISHKIQKKQMKSQQIVQECSILKQVEKQDEEQKPGFFSSLFSSKSKNVQPKPPVMMSKSKKAPMKKQSAYDSDQDEMEFKNCMMQKNDDFQQQ